MTVAAQFARRSAGWRVVIDTSECRTGAGGDAVAATDAGIGVVLDDARLGFLVIADTGQADARRVGAVHARVFMKA